MHFDPLFELQLPLYEPLTSTRNGEKTNENNKRQKKGLEEINPRRRGLDLGSNHLLHCGKSKGFSSRKILHPLDFSGGPRVNLYPCFGFCPCLYSDFQYLVHHLNVNSQSFPFTLITFDTLLIVVPYDHLSDCYVVIRLVMNGV